MSVRVNERKISPIQLLDEAEKLKDLVLERMHSFLKRLKNHYHSCYYEAQNVAYEAYQAPIKLSFDGWIRLKKAYKIWINNEKDFENKKKLLLEAKESYEKIPLYYGTLYKHFRRENLIKEHTVIVLNKIIFEILEKIDSQIKKDKKVLISLQK